MSEHETSPFVYQYQAPISATAMTLIWQRWCRLSSWQEWDSSLSGTESVDDGLTLGKRFSVLPLHGPGAIAVSVTALIEGLHFTTTSHGPMGLLSFGHTLQPATATEPAKLIHSVCVQPADAELFAERFWDKFKQDVCESVSTLAAMFVGETIAEETVE